MRNFTVRGLQWRNYIIFEERYDKDRHREKIYYERKTMQEKISKKKISRGH